ncbi:MULTISPECIES: Lrp/AsnC family transcriptional regulator [Paenibacillus]|uniref:HTH-type transcriptional regulator LrpB n=1 Tax=Paenibacillus azoreducens TaxID=116718 RepID=A0A919YEX1_9BACL|nr:HTH-type transcriptional regulator LrpB [Paenibacillus azoreducens]
MNQFTMDEVDLRILEHLIEDSTRSFKEIGELVHLTGQAVGARVRKMEDAGVIEGYTLRWNPERIGLSVQAFVTVFLKSPMAHQQFQSFVQQHKQVVEAHRVSGEGCYWMRVRIGSPQELNELLDKILDYGNYKLSLSIGQMK